MPKPQIPNSKGFTLIEIMTSVAIFAVVMTISMGSILSVIGANRKSEALKTVMDNLNLSVESMSREMRFGTAYHCRETGDFDPRPCSDGDHYMAFRANDGREIIYEQNGGEIDKSSDGGTTFVPVTAPEITIEDLTFYVLGSRTDDHLQPKVVIKIKGSAGTKENEKTDFTVETLVSQRPLDYPL